MNEDNNLDIKELLSQKGISDYLTKDEIEKINSKEDIQFIKDLPKDIFKLYSWKQLDEKRKELESFEEFAWLDRISQILENKNLIENATPNMKKFIIDVINSDSRSYLENIEQWTKKAKKFDDITKFIPSIDVLVMYPEDQIEKFNKKVWFQLARNEVFNKNKYTKRALVNAVLSLGVFEADENQLERIGLLQKMASNIPKTIKVSEEDKRTIDNDKESKNLFKVVNKTIDNVKYTYDEMNLMFDKNILNLFDSKEQVLSELDKLPEILSKEAYDALLKRNKGNSARQQIMTYIYKNGYKKEEEYTYEMRLNVNLQELKSKNKKESIKIEKKIRSLYDRYYKGDGYVSTSIMYTIFKEMDMEYKPGFYEFLNNNLAEILKDESKQENICNIQRKWDKIVEANLGQKVNFDKCDKYFLDITYKGIKDNEKEIAKLSSMCGYSQADFDKVKLFYEMQLERVKSSIPQIEGKNNLTNYSYKVLRLDDPTAIFVGELTHCCQTLNNLGVSCMEHSVTSPNGRILVVQDEKGKILSQSWIWRNKNILCFDNVEAIKKDSDNKKIISKEILDTVKQAAREFVETDKGYFNKLEKKIITECELGNITYKQGKEELIRLNEIRKNQQLTKVTVGIGHTDIDLKGLKPDNENQYPEEFVDYIDDSRRQLILYEDKTIEHNEIGQKTIPMYTDDEKSKKLIDLELSEIHYNELNSYDWISDEYNYDEPTYVTESEIDNIKELEFSRSIIETRINNKIQIEDVRRTIQHVRGREKARLALYNIMEINKNIGEDNER